MALLGISSFNVVAVYVDNFDKAFRFYTEVLGFEKKQDMGPGVLLELKDQLSLYLEGGRKPRPENSEGTLPECVLCFSTNEGLKASFENLKEAGVEIFGEYEEFTPEFHMFRLCDPAGNLIEFAGKP